MSISKHQAHLLAAMPKSLVLVGHMGSGKSCVGRKLAEILNMNYADSDQRIEAIAGISTADIFELYGEEKFRTLETREIKTLLNARPRQIISVGGGAFCQPASHEAIKKAGLSLWLQAQPKTLIARISNTSSRPLLKDGDPLKIITALAAKRDAFYAQADLVVNTDGLEITESVEKVLDTLITYFKIG